MSITIVRPFLLLPAFASFSLFHIGAPIVGQGDYQVSPDGTHVVFSGDRDVHNVTELYSVKSTGGPIVKLSGPFPPATHDEVVDFRISPDGRTVVYLAEQAFHDRFELFSVPIEGGVPVRIGSPFINQGDVLMQTGPDAFEIGLDGTQVIYIADQQVNERFELFAAPIHGGPSVRLNRALAAGCDVRDFLISPDRKRVLFHADHLVQHDVELFSASLGGPPRAVRLSDFLQFVPFDRGGSIVSPDGKWVVYARDDPDPLDEVESFAVRVVPADGTRFDPGAA